MYERLQKVGLCLSHRSTVTLVEHLGKHFDWKVKEWQRVAEDKLGTSQVLMNCYTIEGLSAANEHPLY